MRAGTGCLLRHINDFSNETKKVLFTYSYSAQAENAEKNWNLTGEVNRLPHCPVFRPRFWSAGQSLQAAQTISHISREKIFLEFEKLKQGGSHCSRDQELHCLMYGQEAVIWWVLTLVSFSNVDIFFQTKEWFGTDALSLHAAWNSAEKEKGSTSPPFRTWNDLEAYLSTTWEGSRFNIKVKGTLLTNLVIIAK